MDCCSKAPVQSQSLFIFLVYVLGLWQAGREANGSPQGLMFQSGGTQSTHLWAVCAITSGNSG